MSLALAVMILSIVYNTLYASQSTSDELTRTKPNELWKGWSTNATDISYDPGFYDEWLIHTESLNQWFLSSELRRDALLVTCSLMIDTIMLASFYRFARYGTTWRFPLALSGFYFCRALL